MNTTVEITHREASGCVILDIKAENFTYPQNAILKNHVAHLLQAGHKLFVLNLSQVQLLDSYGLATIVSVLKMIKEKNGTMALCGLNDTINYLVEVTSLDKVLEIWSSEAQATYFLTSQ